MERLFATIVFGMLTLPVHAQWIEVNAPSHFGVIDFAVAGTNIFACSWGNGILRSTNNGLDWSVVNSGLMSPTDSLVHALVVSGFDVFAGGLGGVFRSTNNGANWTRTNSGLTDTMVQCLALCGANLFAGTFHHGVFLSTDNGTSWNAASPELANSSVNTLAVNGTNLFAGTFGSGIWRSTDSGKNWNAVNAGLITEGHILSIVFSGTDIFATKESWSTTPAIVFRSTDNGTNWTETSRGLPAGAGSGAQTLAVSGTSLFATGSTAGVWHSTNNCTSWASAGLTDKTVSALIVIGGNLFAGSGSIWYRPLSEMITGMEDEHNELTSRVVIDQNYPNPFNPSTTIRYALPIKSHVSLTVYNTLGIQVAVMVEGAREAGYHEAVFHAKGMASGVYFYRLRAGEFVQTKRFVLLR